MHNAQSLQLCISQVHYASESNNVTIASRVHNINTL